ncbi:hypothetical protein ZIOFF_068810 [Zingiber officinale]|uniref:Uncharacterized protein n=1 Tax=Zingiber officinale TaxID=94328 RepID=A0A8J5CCW2_ZINOF|nr:hypothetical protein ZIOFF_068810 [Zingiber officinale]
MYSFLLRRRVLLPHSSRHTCRNVLLPPSSKSPPSSFLIRRVAPSATKIHNRNENPRSSSRFRREQNRRFRRPSSTPPPLRDSATLRFLGLQVLLTTDAPAASSRLVERS